MDEIAYAIKNMQNEKTPSLDGLPAEFYKMIWPKIGNLLYNVYTEIINNGKLHDSARCGIITLLEKLGKNTLLFDNWKPLSLLNVDYNIYTKVISNRMQEALPLLIQLDPLNSSLKCKAQPHHALLGYTFRNTAAHT